VGETADDLSGARRLRGIAPYGFRAVRGARERSGVQVEARRLVPHSGCAVGCAHRIRRMGLSTHAARELAPPPGRAGWLSDWVYRALSSSRDLPGAVFPQFTRRPWVSGPGRQSRDLLVDLAPLGVNRVNAPSIHTLVIPQREPKSLDSSSETGSVLVSLDRRGNGPLEFWLLPGAAAPSSQTGCAVRSVS